MNSLNFPIWKVLALLIMSFVLGALLCFLVTYRHKPYAKSASYLDSLMYIHYPRDGAWEMDSTGVLRKLWHTDTLVVMITTEKIKWIKRKKNGEFYSSTSGAWEERPIRLFDYGRSRDTIYKHEVIYY